MDILIEDIPEEGLSVNATAPSDGWLKKMMLEVLSQGFLADDHAELDVFCATCNREVDLTGDLVYTGHATCDRCLKNYTYRSALDLHLHLSPLATEGRYEEGTSDIVRDDVDFSFYEGDRFDLADIVREQLLLSQPMKHLCQESCQGLCAHCGKDLNEGRCGCKHEAEDPRWAPLKKLKTKTD